jgi:chromosome segregation ATPase
MKRIVVAIISMSALVSLAHADDKSASRDKEMLRRTQQALKAEQDQHSAAEQEKSALATDKAKLQNEIKKNSAQLASVQAQSRGARAELDRAHAEVDRLKAELDATRTADEQAQGALKQSVERLGLQLSQTQRLLSERTSANQTLISLLERSLESLAGAEAKNRELHAAGLKAVEAYRQKGVGAALAQREPVFGFGAVQVDNVAEGLRSQLDAQRVPSAFRREGASSEEAK